MLHSLDMGLADGWDDLMEALGLTMNREGSAKDLEYLATGLSQLYRTAAKEWPARRYTQTVTVSDAKVEIELRSWPLEMEALISA